MNRFLTLFSILILLQSSAFAQNFRDNRKKADGIKANAEYYWGESENCKNQRKADEDAIEQLLENISKDKSLQTVYFQDSDDEDEQRGRVFHTFAEVLKKNSYDLVLDNTSGTAKCFRYIKKADFANICKQRELRINDYIVQGMAAEEQLRCGDALRYYYWGLMLCHSHPNGENLLFIDPDTGLDSPTYRWLLRRTETLLSDITVVPRRQDKGGDNEFIFGVNVLGNGINGLDFEYNNGNGTAITSVNNGICHIKLVDHDMSSVTLIINLENRDAAKFFDPEVYSILNDLDEQIDFPSAKKTVEIDKAKKVKNIDEMRNYANEFRESMQKTEAFVESVQTPEQKYTNMMKTIEKAIYQRNSEMARQLFTADGFTMFQSMLDSGKGEIIATPNYKFLDFKDKVICRSIPMRFDFNNRVSFVRDVVFRIDPKTMLVESLAFRLTDIAESQILSKDKWSNDAKLTLLDFLEDYQTAYALKRREYLNQIFSENALIIVGSVLKETKKSDNINMREEVKIKYDTLSKGQYIANLNRIFNNNEFVNLTFTNTDFNTVSGINDVIGVQVKQEYLSSTYGDTGFLFLMVDLRGAKPVIHVRTWQPKETPVDDKIDANSFVFD
ncbi:MAG: hypothetical protein Q4F69_11765 [Bacteroidia bacterium]|nr:hypothetical protein [Bacteroidia bacterium]